jgi:xylulokinase
MAIYVGFDSSTQSLTALAIEVEGARRRVVFQRSLDFDRDFPRYRTTNGVLPRTDPLVATSSPLMWAEALDRMMEIIATESRINLADVRAISGAAQQHGSVYLASGAAATLATLDPARPLVDQLDGVFTRRDSPIWMDSSTAAECAAITRAIGGDVALARLTGSRAFERFTGPQIRKFSEQDPGGYARTGRVHLVSSWMASLVAGADAPIEPGDGSGMNLMDLAARQWAPAALDATAPGLALKLPALEPSWTIVGPLSHYWTTRYGFPPARVVAWSGDNPSSLIGTALVREGRIAISLGTSDTLFGFMREPTVDPSGTGHVFGSPTGDYMSLVCFKNGSLARDRIRQEHGLDWDGFSRALRETPPGNGGAIMLPWFDPEITPPVLKPGVRRYGLDPSDMRANVRAVVEGQMMAMAIHSAWMGVQVDTIHATGGAAGNREILQVMADVFDASVFQLEVGNSACLGAALRAWHADELAEGRSISWDEIVAGFVEPIAGSRISPVPEHVQIYRDLRQAYAACETQAPSTI